MTKIAAHLHEAGVVPVIRTSSAALARKAVELLREEGFAIFEITLTTPGALELIRDLAQDSDLTIGVGTVLSTGDGQDAIHAGARFVVSPAYVPGLAALCRARETALALGAATPSEVLRAHQDGADFVKIFPASQLGGPGFLKALRSVFPDIALMPTGGINPPDIAPYLAAGALCLGMGGNLVSEAALRANDDAAIRQAAKAVHTALLAR